MGPPAELVPTYPLFEADLVVDGGFRSGIDTSYVALPAADAHFDHPIGRTRRNVEVLRSADADERQLGVIEALVDLTVTGAKTRYGHRWCRCTEREETYEIESQIRDLGGMCRCGRFAANLVPFMAAGNPVHGETVVWASIVVSASSR